MTTDIWNDDATTNYLRYMRNQRFADALPTERQRILKRAKQHQFVGEDLYRRDRSGQWRQIPQPEHRLKIIQNTHAGLGHRKNRVVLSHLRKHYYWAGMESDVQRVIKACSTCAQTTPRYLPPPSKLTPQIAQYPFQRWGIDIVTMSQTSRDKYLITCVDYFTRWIEVGMLRNKTAKATCDWLKREILHRYGRPEVIVSDLGGEFNSDFRKLLRQQGISHRRGRPRHPQTNGVCERFNGTIQETITSLQKEASQDCPDRPKAWTQFMSSAAHAYRCAYHSSIERTPYEVVFGQHPRPFIRPEELEEPEKELEEPEKELEDLEEESIDDAQFMRRMTKLAQIRSAAAASDKRSREKNQKRFLAKRKQRSAPLEVPNEIYLRNPDKSRKRDDKVTGPYTVLACRMNQDRLQIQLPCGKRPWVDMNDCAPFEQTL